MQRAVGRQFYVLRSFEQDESANRGHKTKAVNCAEERRDLTVGTRRNAKLV